MCTCLFVLADDSVYMADADLLQEYVLNETGKIYAGNYRKISPKPWVYGQVRECGAHNRWLFLHSMDKVKRKVKDTFVQIYSHSC